MEVPKPQCFESFGVPFLGTGLLWKSRRQKARGAVARVPLERVSRCKRAPLLEVDAGKSLQDCSDNFLIQKLISFFLPVRTLVPMIFCQLPPL